MQNFAIWSTGCWTRRPLHDDEAGLLQMLHQAPSHYIRNQAISVMHPLPPFMDQREGKSFGNFSGFGFSHDYETALTREVVLSGRPQPRSMSRVVNCLWRCLAEATRMIGVVIKVAGSRHVTDRTVGPSRTSCQQDGRADPQISKPHDPAPILRCQRWIRAASTANAVPTCRHEWRLGHGERYLLPGTGRSRSTRRHHATLEHYVRTRRQDARSSQSLPPFRASL